MKIVVFSYEADKSILNRNYTRMNIGISFHLFLFICLSKVECYKFQPERKRHLRWYVRLLCSFKKENIFFFLLSLSFNWTRPMWLNSGQWSLDKNDEHCFQDQPIKTFYSNLPLSFPVFWQIESALWIHRRAKL